MNTLVKQIQVINQENVLRINYYFVSFSTNMLAWCRHHAAIPIFGLLS